jgi:hypothetical protein
MANGLSKSGFVVKFQRNNLYVINWLNTKIDDCYIGKSNWSKIVADGWGAYVRIKLLA